MLIKRIAMFAALTSATMMSQAFAHAPSQVSGGVAGMIHHLLSEGDHIAAWVGAFAIGVGLVGVYLYNRSRRMHGLRDKSE